MCGIFGISTFEPDKSINEARLQEMVKIMRHRGPDGNGVFAADRVGFGHARLSLIDIDSRSNQPFWDHSKKYCIVYNGEIYNYLDLRSELEGLGYVFKTNSDTEVALYYLIHYGVDGLGKLEGMFSLAFYIRDEESIILVRDRFGIKPLYYYQDEKRLIFCSEIHPIRNWIDLEIDKFSISSYLMGFGGPNASFTFYNKVKILPNGSYLKVKQGRVVEQSSFYSIDDFLDHDQFERLSTTKSHDIVDELEDLLKRSIKKHMIADIPVGALCSGGVDSSLILALAAQENKNLSIFHANVSGPLSEFAYASQLANYLNLDMKVVEVSDSDFIDRIPQVTYHFGQPFIYHPNSVPFMMVCGLVNDHNVKAILTGEAADECFLGYSHIPTQELFNSYYDILGKMGLLIRKIPAFGTRFLPKCGDLEMATVRNLHNRFEEISDALPSSDVVGKTFDKGVVKTNSYLKYHLRTLLHRNDMLGMSQSIEARFPFLDHDVVKFSMNLPYKNKIRFSTQKPIELKHPFFKNKWAMRNLAERYLPADLSNRPKKGFPTNAFERMTLSESFFENSFVSELFELSKKEIKILSQVSDREFQLRLMHLDVWGRVCFLNDSFSDTAHQLKEHLNITSLS